MTSPDAPHARDSHEGHDETPTGPEPIATHPGDPGPDDPNAGDAHAHSHPDASHPDASHTEEPRAPETSPAPEDGEHEPLGAPGQLLPVRRSVRYPAFLLTGALAGFLLGALLEVFGPTREAGGVYTSASSFSFIAMLFALLGCLVGGIVALVLDRRG